MGKSVLPAVFFKETKLIKLNKSTWTIGSVVNCESSNIVYLIKCQKEECKERYIDESSRPLKKRVKEHVDYILRLFSTQATGQHYNMPEHDLSNMAITVLEKVHKYDDFYRQEREK